MFRDYGRSQKLKESNAGSLNHTRAWCWGCWAADARFRIQSARIRTRGARPWLWMWVALHSG